MRKKISEERLHELIEQVLFDIDESKINSKTIKMTDIVLDRTETYDATKQNCWSFRKKGDIRDNIDINLGNMVSGYPFEMFGHSFKDSECAYIAGCYSDKSKRCFEIQTELSNYTKGGFNAKNEFRKATTEKTSYIRKDWTSFNFDFMLLVIWSKCNSNEDFKNVLLSIPENAHIIEDTSYHHGATSDIWGAKNIILTKLRKQKCVEIEQKLIEEGVTVKKTIESAQQIVENRINNYGKWIGINATGKAIKMCQLALLNNTTPSINYKLLNSKKIYWFGELLKF